MGAYFENGVRDDFGRNQGSLSHTRAKRGFGFPGFLSRDDLLPERIAAALHRPRRVDRTAARFQEDTVVIFALAEAERPPAFDFDRPAVGCDKDFGFKFQVGREERYVRFGKPYIAWPAAAAGGALLALEFEPASMGAFEQISPPSAILRRLALFQNRIDKKTSS